MTGMYVGVGAQRTNQLTDLGHGEHFSCVLSAVLLARVEDYGGPRAVSELLSRAKLDRSPEELTDLANWIAYDEAESLWAAGRVVTRHPRLAEAVGRDSARRLAATPTAATLRSLGCPERVYEQISLTSRKYSSVSDMQLVRGEPGYAHLRARPFPGFPRSSAHCGWTVGLMGCMVELFGLPSAEVEHTACAAFGAPTCEYHVRWITSANQSPSSSIETALRAQVAAQEERLHGVFQTASDLVGSGSIDDVLAQIARRAAVEVRAPPPPPRGGTWSGPRTSRAQ